MMPTPSAKEIFDELLRWAVESRASDVVVKTDRPAYFRLAGKLQMMDTDPVTAELARAFVDQAVPAVFRDAWKRDAQVDFAYKAADVGRFRVNAFHQRGQVSIVFRHIKTKIPSFDDLNLQPEPLLNLAQGKDGILLFCGATGMGKSSTMAAMLNWINENQEKHIVTIEDPIEYTFSDNKSVFNQREIGIDVPSFALAIKSVLRQNPDIILIGEMRDAETFETAISAAETGHLVISTMHAATVSQALTRLFEFFPVEHQAQARRQVAGALRGIVCQKLIPSMDGQSRVPANEVLFADATIRNLILEGSFDKVQGLLEGSSDSRTFSFNKDLYRLIKAGKVSKAEGLRFSPNPQALEMNLKGIFIKS